MSHDTAVEVTEEPGARAPSGPPRWLLPLAVVVLFLLLGGGLSGPGGRLAEVQRNDSTAYLPHGSESVAALTENVRSAVAALQG